MDPLLTLEGFAQRHGVNFDPTDVKALRALQDASGFIRGYTHQDITLVEDDEVKLDGTGTAKLLLPQLPVGEISEVLTLEDDGTETEIEDYRVDTAGRLSRLDGWCWPIAHANVVITYDHGYAEVPQDIQGACYELALDNYVASGGGTVTSETIGNYSVTYDAASAGGAELPDRIRYVLDCYRVPQ